MSTDCQYEAPACADADADAWCAGGQDSPWWPRCSAVGAFMVRCIPPPYVEPRMDGPPAPCDDECVRFTMMRSLRRYRQSPFPMALLDPANTDNRGRVSKLTELWCFGRSAWRDGGTIRVFCAFRAYRHPREVVILPDILVTAPYAPTPNDLSDFAAWRSGG